MAGYDVVGIGNALVDVVAHTDEGFLAAQGLAKGAMTLVEADAADRLYAAMPPGIECSGGSCGNTMAGLASLGGRGAYIGVVHDDQLGRVFRHDLTAIGIDFATPAAAGGPPTGRCLVLVTADAERTMATFLGAAATLAPGDIDPLAIGAAKVVYLEGYLFDREAAKQAFVKAAELAHAAGRKVALTLSDGFCVERHRAAFRHLVEHHVDILFANETEITALYQTPDFDAAARAVAGHCEIACLTRSAKGSVVLANGDRHVVPAASVARVVDTTGAGDLYAAGFLYGYTQGLPLPEAGRIGALAAAEVIGHYGARPAADLAALLAQG